MNFVAVNKQNGKRYQVKAQHWPEHGWHFQILDRDPETWGRSTTGVGAGPVIDQGFQKQLEQRGWKIVTADPITPGNATNSVGPLPEPENIRNRAMKDIANKLKHPESAASIVNTLLDHAEHDNTPEERREVAIGKQIRALAMQVGSQQIVRLADELIQMHDFPLTAPKASFYPSMGGPSSV